MVGICCLLLFLVVITSIMTIKSLIELVRNAINLNKMIDDDVVEK